MIPTSQDLRRERERFTHRVQAALGPRARIRLDPEGWPFAPARHGRIEWRGAEPDGTERLYAYTEGRLIRGRLLAIPGVRRVQVGDEELVVSMAADDGPTIQAVAALLQTRSRRLATAADHLRKPATDAEPGPNFASQEGPEGLDMGPGRPGADRRT